MLFSHNFSIIITCPERDSNLRSMTLCFLNLQSLIYPLSHHCRINNKNWSIFRAGQKTFIVLYQSCPRNEALKVDISNYITPAKASLVLSIILIKDKQFLLKMSYNTLNG